MVARSDLLLGEQGGVASAVGEAGESAAECGGGDGGF